MITAHPLSWPAGWPRTTTRKRADFGRKDQSSQWRSKKRLEVSDGLNRVLAELEHLGVDRQDVIISTNVRTRLDGLPRSGEAEPKDPGAAVYWVMYQTMKGGVGERAINPPLIKQDRVMAIDRYDRVADNLAAIAATLGALRAIARHGGGQILERAFTGFAALAAPDADKSWREVLGLPPDADHPNHIRDVYQKLRGRYHPDHEGGSAEMFNKIQRAYDQACAELGL